MSPEPDAARQLARAAAANIGPRLPGEIVRVVVIDPPGDAVLSAHVEVDPAWLGDAGRRSVLADQLRSIAAQLDLDAY